MWALVILKSIYLCSKFRFSVLRLGGTYTLLLQRFSASSDVFRKFAVFSMITFSLVGIAHSAAIISESLSRHDLELIHVFR